MYRCLPLVSAVSMAVMCGCPAMDKEATAAENPTRPAWSTAPPAGDANVARVPAGAAELEIVVPTETIRVGQHYLLEVKRLTTADLSTSKLMVAPDTAKAVGVTGWAGEQYVWFVASERGRHFVAVIVVRDGSPVSAIGVLEIGEPGPPVPPPAPPDTGITRAAVLAWLSSVPGSARTEVIDNPVTGKKLTREQAVGGTFVEVGGAAAKLGSITAVNVMLTTGLVAAFGSKGTQWKAFASLADAALGKLEAKGVSPTEYGKALATIGGALL